MNAAMTEQPSTRLGGWLVILTVLALLLPVGPAGWWLGQGTALAMGLLILSAALWVRAAETDGLVANLALAGLTLLGSTGALLLASTEPGWRAPGLWLMVLAQWLLAWRVMTRLSALAARPDWQGRLARLLVPTLFGIGLLYLWEIAARGFGIPAVLLPAPSAIGAAFASSLPTLLADFHQTYVRSVVPGWIMGCTAGFLTAILIDRVPFLQRGLLPLGNLVSAMPVVGIAPIMVMWFGFDWHSKAAVVVVMTFFPMLVNALAGLAAAGRIEHDLMRTWAASYGRTLLSLRLPTALPFLFNALKINSTLALIGAIVAEFFGTPTVGMGFRISTEVGRMSIDLVWASIAMAALAGSLSYALLAALERYVTFWHPSFRR